MDRECMRYSPGYVFPLVLVFLVVFSGCHTGNSTLTGRISGNIYLSADQKSLITAHTGTQPVGDVQVVVQNTNLLTQTSQDGAFLLANVPPGQQTLLLTKKGYQGVTLALKVKSNATVNVADGTASPLTRKWTVLVFLNAANDLEPFGIQNMNDMESVPDSPLVTTVVQMKRSPDYDTSNGNWHDTRRFVIHHDSDTNTITSPVVQMMGDSIDMGKPETLSDFITWGERNYPAEHYLLDIWNHGSGWQDFASRSVPSRGVSYDDTTSTCIHTVDLPSALVCPVPLDVIAFDASLMQMAEIAYQIRQNCSYLVASEESPPGLGYPYSAWLGALVANPALDPRALAVSIAAQTLAFYGTDSDITQSVIDVTKLEGLADAVAKFTTALTAVATADATPLSNARYDCEYYKYPDYRDLYRFAELVESDIPADSNVTSAAEGVKSAISSAVIANYHGQLHPYSHGISILPARESDVYRRRRHGIYPTEFYPAHALGSVVECATILI